MKFKSALFAMTASLVCLGACVQTSLLQQAENAGEFQRDKAPRLFEDRNVLILLESAQEANELAVNGSRRGYQLSERRRLDGLGLILLEFQRPPGVSDEVAINDMRQMSPSATVGLDDLYRTQETYEAPVRFSPQLYANDMLGWPTEGCQAQTAVGIIDGYISSSASGISGRNVISRNFMRGQAAASQHAEAVANLLLGRGRLNDAKIYSAGVIGTTRSGVSGSGVKELVLALDWMRAENVPLVNVSLAGPNNPVLERAIAQVTEDGMVLVAAVGNKGPDAPPQYPAAFGSVIGVTAIDADRDIFRDAVRGTHVEYAAPGVDIYIDNGKNNGRFVSGTSFAAPFVTALIAADASRSFSASSSGVRSFLDQRTMDLGATGPDPVFGKGMIVAENVCAT